jgi:hypothetical protein
MVGKLNWRLALFRHLRLTLLLSASSLLLLGPQRAAAKLSSWFFFSAEQTTQIYKASGQDAKFDTVRVLQPAEINEIDRLLLENNKVCAVRQTILNTKLMPDELADALKLCLTGNTTLEHDRIQDGKKLKEACSVVLTPTCSTCLSLQDESERVVAVTALVPPNVILSRKWSEIESKGNWHRTGIFLGFVIIAVPTELNHSKGRANYDIYCSPIAIGDDGKNYTVECVECYSYIKECLVEMAGTRDNQEKELLHGQSTDLIERLRTKLQGRVISDIKKEYGETR